MAAYTYWFILALILLGLEMMTGTFYMLVLSVALALGGVAALAGLDLVWQISLAGAAAVIGILLLRRSRAIRTPDANNDSFDIGQPVRVIAWENDGSVRVQYRGAEWSAETEQADVPRDAPLYIRSVQGSKLILTQQKS
jgi:membrane protein implicated in regulation of membrane protease activity